MYPSQGPCADSQLGLWCSTNSVNNTNTDYSQLAENKLLADEKGPWKSGAGSIYIYSIL